MQHITDKDPLELVMIKKFLESRVPVLFSKNGVVKGKITGVSPASGGWNSPVVKGYYSILWNALSAYGGITTQGGETLTTGEVNQLTFKKNGNGVVVVLSYVL